MREMFAADARRARSIGQRITEARQAGDSNKERAFRRRAAAMVEKFGPVARREVGAGRREGLRRKRR